MSWDIFAFTYVFTFVFFYWFSRRSLCSGTYSWSYGVLFFLHLALAFYFLHFGFYSFLVGSALSCIQWVPRVNHLKIFLIFKSGGCEILYTMRFPFLWLVNIWSSSLLSLLFCLLSLLLFLLLSGSLPPFSRAHSGNATRFLVVIV